MQNLPFTIIADEVTDSHANQEILSACLRFVDLALPREPKIKECLIYMIYLERANAEAIAKKYWNHYHIQQFLWTTSKFVVKHMMGHL